MKAYPKETTEAFLDGHVSAFAFLGGVPRSILYDNTTLAVARILGDGTRQIGYTGGRSLRGKWPAPGDMSIWLDDVGCMGSESRLDACPHPGWGQHNCAVREAVGVRCSGTRQILEPPPDPKPATGLSASGATTTTVGLSWTLPTQPGSVTVTRVEVQRQSDTTWSSVTRLGASATTHTVTGLTAGTAHSFRIRLVTSGGNADSDAVSADTLAAPKPATGLASTDPTQTTVDLAWTLPAQGSGVSVTGVEVQQQSGTTWSTVATLGASATTHTVTGLTAGTRYIFRIRLVTSGGNADSDAVSADTLAAPRAATGLAASDPTQSTIDLAWTLPAQGSGVSVTGVEVQQQSGTTWSTVATLGASAAMHTVTGLSASTTYSFRIRLVTNSGSADSDTVSAGTLAAPRAATGLTALNATPTTVDLSWTLPEQPEGLTVTRVLLLQQAADDSRTMIKPLAADATSHTVTGLTASTSYSFRIEIQTSGGNTRSDTVSADTPVVPKAATGLTASNVTHTTADLSWTLPEQPEGVTVSAAKVLQLRTGRDVTVVATLSADATSYKVTELAAGTDHYFRIRLVTSRGTQTRWR